MTKTVTGLVLLVVAVGAGWFVYQNRDSVQSMFKGQTESAADSYGYVCSDGSEFGMVPSNDAESLTLTPGVSATFAAATIHKTPSASGAVYEGEGLIFAGVGETVTLTVGTAPAVTCNPKPSTEMAPWNWGDPAEGAGSIQPNAALVVSESIMGTWQSVDDSKYSRAFKEGGVVEDWYEGKKVSSGMWVAFLKGIDAPEVPFPLEDGVVYLQLTMSGTQADTLNFKVNKLTPEALELTYLDRGGVLRYTLVR